MSSTEEVSEQPGGTGPLMCVSLCVACFVATCLFVSEIFFVFSIFAGAKLDCWLAPHRTFPEWNCDDVSLLTAFFEPNYGHSYLEARASYALRNNVTLQNAPRSCQLIHATDVASSTSKAQQCAAWCEEHLGQAAGAPVDLLFFYSALLPQNEAVRHSLKLFTTCFKAETAAVAGSYITNTWLVGLLYRLVGLMPAALLLWRSRAGDGAGDETQTTNPPDDDSPFSDSELGFPRNCGWRPTTDFTASRFHLAKSAFSVVTEPLFDAVSVLTFLKNGQPFYFVAMTFGLLVSFLLSGMDALQSTGALALVRSWRRGFATKDLLQQRLHDLPECFISTCIQLYAALSVSWSHDPRNVIQLGMFAWMSTLLTLPEATAVMVVSQTGTGYFFLPFLFGQQGANVDDFHEFENAKTRIGIRKYILPVVLVAYTQAVKDLFVLLLGNVKFDEDRGRACGAFVALTFFPCAYPLGWLKRLYLPRIFCFVSVLCLSISLPSQLQTLLESIGEIPWTWPLLWPHWPWPVPQIRWDILAAAMQTFSHMAGFISMYAVALGQIWLYYEIATEVENTKGESHQPLVENHSQDPDMVELETQSSSGENSCC